MAAATRRRCGSGGRCRERRIDARVGARRAPSTSASRWSPRPDAGPGQVRIRLEGSGVCASSVPVWEGRPWFWYPAAPGAPGHEGLGHRRRARRWRRPVAVGDARRVPVDARLRRVRRRGGRRGRPRSRRGCPAAPARARRWAARSTRSIAAGSMAGDRWPSSAWASSARRSSRSPRTPAPPSSRSRGARSRRRALDSRRGGGRRPDREEEARRCWRWLAATAWPTWSFEAGGVQPTLTLASTLCRDERPARDRRLSPGRPAHGRPVALELARPRHRERARARAARLRDGHATRVRAVRRGVLDLDALFTHRRRWTAWRGVRVDRAIAPDGFLKARRDDVMPRAPARLPRPRLDRPPPPGGDRRHGRAEIVALADVDARRVDAAAALAPDAARGRSLDDLLAHRLDGVVIATPSALPRDRSGRSRSKPAAPSSARSRWRARPSRRPPSSRAPRADDRRLAVDLSYRQPRRPGASAIWSRAARSAGCTPSISTFHNAYGPDKPWFRKTRMAGGGCLIDLGIHLVDLLALWVPEPFTVRAAALSTRGEPWAGSAAGVEDFAVVQLESRSGVAARVACSWGTPSGCDAVIEARIFGTRAGARIANVAGSFYDFTAEQLEPGRAVPLAQPPDDWGGRAAVAWVDALAASPRFDAGAEQLVELSALIDRCYDTASRRRARLSARRREARTSEATSGVSRSRIARARRTACRSRDLGGLAPAVSGATSRDTVAAGDRHHLAEPDDAARLDEIEVGARFERMLTQRRVGLRGQHDDDRVAAARLFAQGTDERHAAFRHHQLDDDDVGRLGPRGGEAGVPRGGGGHGERPLGQPQVVQLARIRVPFDEQHGRRGVVDRGRAVGPGQDVRRPTGVSSQMSPSRERWPAAEENPRRRSLPFSHAGSAEVIRTIDVGATGLTLMGRRGSQQRHEHGRAADARVAAQIDVAAVPANQFARDGEAEAEPAVRAGGGVVQLAERLEDVLDLRPRRSPCPVSETKMSTCSPDWRMHGAHLAAGRRVLDGVVEDVTQRGPQAGRIAEHPCPRGGVRRRSTRMRSHPRSAGPAPQWPPARAPPGDPGTGRTNPAAARPPATSPARQRRGARRRARAGGGRCVRSPRARDRPAAVRRHAACAAARSSPGSR